jgi:hemin uptake protein HemP
MMKKPLSIQCEVELNNRHRKNDTQSLRVSSADILRDYGRIIIEHNGEDYILRITRNDKLMLTK